MCDCAGIVRGMRRRRDDMSILESIFGGKIPMPTEEPKPEFKQNKKYRLCINDNPDKEDHSYKCNKTFVVPQCSLSLSLDELTTEEVGKIAIEIRAVLEQNGFVLR
jgi:hypothetical protein